MSPSLATHPVPGSAVARANIDNPPRPKGGDSEVRSNSAPRRLGAWQLEALLADGERTQIFRATPLPSEGKIPMPGRYAMKVLRETSEDDAAAVAQLRQEANVGQCVSHRHLAPVLSAHIHRTPYYIVLPWLDAIDVKSLLRSRGRLDLALALWITRQAAQALEALHTAGYTHGDLNPSNLLFTVQGHVTLVDLGCSRRLDDGTAAVSLEPGEDELYGTPNYLAPEIFQGNQADPRSDLYSLGIALFEMLAGRLPPLPQEIAALAQWKREASLPDVRNYNPQVSVDAAQLIKELTARELLRRPRTARRAIERFLRLEIATLKQRVY